MRGKKTSDLIWNGSPKSGKSNRARVELTFDNSPQGNSRRLLDLDFDEVSLERVVHRDASTDYKINGSLARLKDIVELLAGAHIGASGHHIISQGETDLILNVNLHERRGMIEDALGLKVFQYKKEESLRKLGKVELNKKELASLRREIAPHIEFLKSQVRKVEKARDIRDALKDLYKKYFSQEQYYLEKETKRIGNKRGPLESSLKQIQEELKDAKETLDTLEEKEEASECTRSLELELQTLQQERQEKSRALGRIEGAIEADMRRIERQKSRDEEEAYIRVSRADITKIDAEIDRLEDADTSMISEVIASLRSIVRSVLERYQSTGTDIVNDAEHKRLKYEHKDIEGEMEVTELRIKKVHESIKDLQEQVRKERKSLRGAERATYELKAQESEVVMKLGVLDGAEKELYAAGDEYEQEKKEAYVFVGINKGDELGHEESRKEQNARKKQIERLKIRLEDAGGGSGEEILREYEEVTERDSFLEREVTDLESSKEKLEILIHDLDKQITTAFKIGVAKINTEFQRFFELMFGGGTAKLDVVKEIKRKHSDFDLYEESDGEEDEEEIEEGVSIDVSLPRKKVRGLQMLSGGERALTSIALLFAMSQVNPPPFLILDETDAALDEANSKRYGDIVEELAKKSQLILISHNRETMSRAGVLYGVTMGADGTSQLLSVDFEEAVQVAK